MVEQLSHQPSDSAYYLEDCRILRAYCPEMYTVPQSVSNVVWQMGNQGPKLVIMTLTVRHKKISSSMPL